MRQLIKRGRDRLRVQFFRASSQRDATLILFWLLLGPGILGENDGPSMISYAATGALFAI
jgi:hypothetical protein